MKKTQGIEILNNIKRNKVPFFAIMILVMLGFAIYTGIGWSGEALLDSVIAEQDAGKMADLELFSPYGFNDNDLEMLEQVEGVGDIEGAYACFQAFEYQGKSPLAKLVTIQDNINCLTQIEGTLPAKNDEIAVEKNWAKKNGLAIGDTVCFDANRKFTVTALAESPAYISALSASYETSPTTYANADCIMFADKSAFDERLFPRYTSALIRHSDTEKLEYGSKEYDDAIDKLQEHIIAEADVTVVTRENNASLQMIRIITDIFETLKHNLAIPFIIISILVSYSTISRMIYKDIRSIGTKKAEGFRDGSIVLNYVLFSISAAVLGLVFGLLISRLIIERLFLNVLKQTFLFEHFVGYFSLGEAALVGGIQLVCILLSVYTAGYATVHAPVMQLLSGNIQSASKELFIENTTVWKRISLLTKSIVYNFVNDKRRVIATLIGIAGCTALVICGTSIMLSVTDSLDYHFDNLQDYRQIVYFDPASESAQGDIREVLEENNIRYTLALYSMIKLNAPTGKDLVAALAVSDRDFDGLMKIRTLDGTDGKLSDEGAWINCAVALNYGIDDKDGVITFTDVSNQSHDIRCSGVYEYYLQNPRIVMSAEAYRKEFSKEPVPNVFLVDPGDMDRDTLHDKLADIPGFISVFDQYESMKNTFGIIVMVTSAIAVIYIILSAIMAVFILMDLFIMFVEEKKRELITLMINGYHPRYAKRYIYSDTIFLTVIGLVIGVVIGIVLNIWNVNAMTSDVSYYLHRVSIVSCVGAVLYSTLLTALMCLIAMKRIDKFKLSDLA